MTAPNPVEAEATGQQYITATYEGREYKVLLDVDEWPLDLVAVSVGVTDEGRLVPSYSVLAMALQRLLGDQWPDFMRNFPRRRDLLPASQAFAAAAGFPSEPRDLSFGCLPRLLATLAHRQDAVEATLGQMGLDYRDRWRFNADGQRKLTLRQINVRLSYALPTSPLAIAQNDGRMPFTSSDLLLMDVFEALTHRPHPSRPMSPAQKAAREAESAKKKKAVEDYRQRHQNSRKNTALETARANAQQLGRHAHADARQEGPRQDGQAQGHAPQP
ncbi:hypothetical protein ACEWX3_07590 [Mycobacterium sp. G7A2]|uniref:hypothetical protein n=1 Tax=Mycobacterium sp. G7A2 TaxID=3317307 RepID=UPI0035A8D15B